MSRKKSPERLKLLTAITPEETVHSFVLFKYSSAVRIICNEHMFVIFFE